MKLLGAELLNMVARALRATVPAGFTGTVTIRINFHAGAPASATVGLPQEEHVKLKG